MNKNFPLMNVTELTQAIKLHLEKTFPFVHLEGEISNFKMQGSGHLYFSLKDQHAQISAVMFKKEAQILKKIKVVNRGRWEKDLRRSRKSWYY